LREEDEDVSFSRNSGFAGIIEISSRKVKEYHEGHMMWSQTTSC
jgi:hypothetical protein